MRRLSAANPGLWEAWSDEGVGLLVLASIALVAAGGFAWFLAVTGQLLPHDLAWLTIPEAKLRAIASGRLLEFMEHDRAAFGGTLVAVGMLYLWLVRFPLTDGERWAWWTLAISSTLGFLSFLTYLGTGYLDSWHGLATLFLLPLVGIGLWMTRHRHASVATHAPAHPQRATSRGKIGHWLLVLTGFGMLVAGLTIATIGSFVVFVPQDITFLGTTRSQLEALDAHLVPLIAHDRAGFGGGLATTGLIVMAIVIRGRPSRALWETLLLAGLAGFGAAIGVHEMIGYLDLVHLGPAIVAAVIFATGMILVRPAMYARRGAPDS